ncbi:hypothetical protein BDU57DRAFT_514069 [Ampelomyces quisqualis]|uniref:Uncharacterized protein n=1 Tax=Ampelomyces quisqualis TaxID=50730 RepID=A0A6A5QQQ5_AMPQU|nr:hypothetical protein BDU57DRAFT_514069 [Ampelomyces quisqualis]
MGRIFLEPELYHENQFKQVKRMSIGGRRKSVKGKRKPKHAHLYLAGPRVGTSVGDERKYDRSLSAIKDRALKGDAGISFAGANGPDEFRELSSKVYAKLAKRIIEALVVDGKPYLPRHGYLHVNFPHVTDKTCNLESRFHFVLTAEKPTKLPWLLQKMCGKTEFPLEKDIVHKDGCFVAISFETTATLMRPRDELIVIRKLMPLLTCAYQK